MTVTTGVGPAATATRVEAASAGAGVNQAKSLPAVEPVVDQTAPVTGVVDEMVTV